MYLAIGWDSTYQGLHGYEEAEVVDTDDRRDAAEVAAELARNVVEWSLGDEFKEEMGDDEFDEEEWNLFVEENIEPYVYEIRDDAPLSAGELLEEYHRLGFEDFREQYCTD